MFFGDRLENGSPYAIRPLSCLRLSVCPVLYVTLVYCGQAVSRIKMKLGVQVDLGPGHIVLDGVPAPRERGTAAPIFSAHICCSHGRPSQLLLSSCYLLVCLLHVHVFCYTFQDFSG